MAVLFRRHDPAGSARYQELKQLALSQRRILAGTPGTLKQRTQSGNRYWVREHIRVDGRKTDEYLGPEASTAAAAVERLRSEVELAKALAAGSAALRLLGYQRIDRKPAAVLEVLFNRGLFQAGLALVGSHAYGALLNELGVIAPGYRTQDLDLARARPLAIALADPANLESLLRETGLDFVPVPGMPSRKPSASFKLPGAEALAVDLLVPGARTGEVVAVKELGAWAQAIPLLDFLIDEPIRAAVLSPNQVIPVRVPAPERFALHKLFSSQSRGSADRDKAGKDLGQAAVLSAALEQETPGTFAAAFRAMPRSGKPAVRRASRAAARLLDAHPEAKEALLKIAAG
ncbi:MAG TPA: GSU2403 family nucleotidyltransferase fold protein [Steroidobacteraceae bacterium]|jgi:hypothetical protein